jgi:hypothetical protein
MFHRLAETFNISVPGLNTQHIQTHQIDKSKDLLIKNPNAAVGASRLYTPPINTSQDHIRDLPSETSRLPIEASSDYKKWFFDLQFAKKQMLLDTCKDLIGYTSSIENEESPPPIIEKTYKPTNGRLFTTCSYNLSGDRSVTTALTDTLAETLSETLAETLNDTKLYERDTKRDIKPLKQDIIQDVNTVNMVLKDIKQPTIVKPILDRNSQLQSESIQYDFCSDLHDSTTSPFDIICLQQLFRKFGGKPSGSSYPSDKTIVIYNSMGTIGAVKQYFDELIQNMKSSNNNIQRNAMIQLGVISVIKRAPYIQGVEVFWFFSVSNKVSGFLRRTIEKNFLQFDTSNIIPRIGMSHMIQLTDVRAESDFSVKYKVSVDDGFFISVNQPVSDKTLLNDKVIDDTNVFANIGKKGHYISKSHCNFRAKMPNIVKMFYESHGNHFTFNVEPSTPFFSSPFSLTCEQRAPFLNFEVVNGVFEETRNPFMFSQFITVTGIEYRMRSEERNYVPGSKSFVRLNSANSCINIPNIAYNSWGTISFAIRLLSMPIKETIINFAIGSTTTYFCNIIAKPINGSNAGISISHTFNGKWINIPTSYQLSLNKWYAIFVSNNDSGLDIYCNSIDELIFNHGNASMTRIQSPNKITNDYTQSNIMIGTKNFKNWSEIHSTSSFYYDIAWIHFFDHYVNADDIYRDCMANWIFTQFT